jgi:SAM-dependent methyltransferase
VSRDGQPRQYQQRIVEWARRDTWFGRAFHAISWQRSKRVLSLFEPFLPDAGRVLDIGAGTGHVAALLQRPGRAVVACDILDLLMVPLPFVICDGGRLAFLEGSFDAALLVTVLHHIPRDLHGRFLSEAARVLKPGGRLILMEDVYHSAAELAATKFFDSVMNGEFAGHPHSNRMLSEWIELLRGAGLQTAEQREQVEWYGPFRIRHGIAVAIRP